MFKTNRKTIILALAATFVITILLHTTFVQPFLDSRDAYDYDLTNHRPSRIYPHLVVSEKGPQIKDDSDADGVTDVEEMGLLDLHNMISKTRGFYVRDWSLWLGWNNVRYIIESAVIQAQLLNRTLVLPTYVYARGCEYEIKTCAAYFTMVNRNDALSTDEWRDLPMDLQMGWKIPMGFMIDLPRLRSRHPVITVSEYLELHGLNKDRELSRGNWDRDGYHSAEYIFGAEDEGFDNEELREKKRPSLYVIHNDWYDNDVVRVDLLPDDMKIRGEYDMSYYDSDKGQVGKFLNTSEDTEVHKRLTAALDGRRVLEWERAKIVLKDCRATNNGAGDDEIQTVLEENGWEVLYTYPSHNGMEYMKTVTESARQVAPRTLIRGFRDDFVDVADDVVLLEGETHLERKPGQLVFTTPEARDSFTITVLRYIIAHAKVYELASNLAERMYTLVGSRNWMGAHMRRGDFVRLGWAMEQTIESHLQRIKKHLSEGRSVLVDLHKSKQPRTFDIPDVEPDSSVLTLNPPKSGDSFYLATDERTPEGLSYLKENGAIFITDLITPVDRRNFGPELLITDVLALVEQAILSLGGYFYGSVLSSVSGGIVNMRATNGKDPRTSLAD